MANAEAETREFSGEEIGDVNDVGGDELGGAAFDVSDLGEEGGPACVWVFGGKGTEEECAGDGPAPVWFVLLFSGECLEGSRDGVIAKSLDGLGKVDGGGVEVALGGAYRWAYI